MRDGNRYAQPGILYRTPYKYKSQHSQKNSRKFSFSLWAIPLKWYLKLSAIVAIHATQILWRPLGILALFGDWKRKWPARKCALENSIVSCIHIMTEELQPSKYSEMNVVPEFCWRHPGLTFDDWRCALWEQVLVRKRALYLTDSHVSIIIITRWTLSDCNRSFSFWAHGKKEYFINSLTQILLLRCLNQRIQQIRRFPAGFKLQLLTTNV